MEPSGVARVSRRVDGRGRDSRRPRDGVRSVVVRRHPDWLAPTSAYGLFLLTLAVTPANTYMFTHNAPGPLPEDADESMQVLPWYGHCARGALQVFLLATTWGVAHPPH